MTGGGGIDGVIHRAAGSRLLDECYLHRQVTRGVRLPTGRSRILFSYNLSKTTSYIINTAGPMYSYSVKAECAEQLSSCYRTAMELANLYDLQSVAFPAISCGIFGYVSDPLSTNRIISSDFLL
jgi:O-acetyl-ADP-ribose deacetylase